MRKLKRLAVASAVILSLLIAGAVVMLDVLAVPLEAWWLTMRVGEPDDPDADLGFDINASTETVLMMEDHRLIVGRNAGRLDPLPGMTYAAYVSDGGVGLDATLAVGTAEYRRPTNPLGFGFSRVTREGELEDGRALRETTTTAAVPLWSITALAALPAVAWGASAVRRRRRVTRRASGRCPSCGYGPAGDARALSRVRT